MFKGKGLGWGLSFVLCGGRGKQKRIARLKGQNLISKCGQPRSKVGGNYVCDLDRTCEEVAMLWRFGVGVISSMWGGGDIGGRVREVEEEECAGGELTSKGQGQAMCY